MKCYNIDIGRRYFNPRSPRGLRPDILAAISCGFLFQSTQPKRAATVTKDSFDANMWISIHAAQEGCDNAPVAFCPPLLRYFNPRSPRGLRPLHIAR